MSEPAQFKYRAFLSYSHRDTRAAKQVHSRLEIAGLKGSVDDGGEKKEEKPHGKAPSRSC
jgi:hypothetical protein